MGGTEHWAGAGLRKSGRAWCDTTLSQGRPTELSRLCERKDGRRELMGQWGWWRGKSTVEFGLMWTELSGVVRVGVKRESV